MAETYPHTTSGYVDGGVRCSCGATWTRAYHLGPPPGKTWGRDCPLALREAIDAVTAERDRLLIEFTGDDAAGWAKEAENYAAFLKADNRGGGLVSCPDCGRGMFVDGTADIDLSPRRCLSCERAATIAERDRLQAILDAETGKRGPDDWLWTPHDTWSRYAGQGAPGPSASVWRHADQNGVEWSWRIDRERRGTAKTALAAMEAADLAAKETT